jgi:hypothetical protein
MEANDWGRDRRLHCRTRENRKSNTLARPLLLADSLSGSVKNRRHNPSETESK